MYESYTQGDKDFTALVSKMKADNIDVVYVGGYHTEAGLILRQMRDQGMQATADLRRCYRHQRVLVDHRRRRRRHDVHVRPRSAQQAERAGRS